MFIYDYTTVHRESYSVYVWLIFADILGWSL